MEIDWRAELEACDGFTEKQKGIVKAKLLACEEQGGDTDTAFMWIKTALEVQSDGAELSGQHQPFASSQTSSTSINPIIRWCIVVAIEWPTIARTSLITAWREIAQSTYWVAGEGISVRLQNRARRLVQCQTPTPLLCTAF